MKIWIDVDALDGLDALGNPEAKLPGIVGLFTMKRAAEEREREALRIREHREEGARRCVVRWLVHEVEAYRAWVHEMEAYRARELEQRIKDRAQELRSIQPWHRAPNAPKLFKHTCLHCRDALHPQQGVFYALPGPAEHKRGCKGLQTICPTCELDVGYDYSHRRGPGAFTCRDPDHHQGDCPFYRPNGTEGLIWDVPCQYCNREKSAEECADERARKELSTE